MISIRNVCLLIAGLLLGSGCAVFNGGVELSKTLWGSSTRALEQARDEAITKTYDQKYWDVVRAAEEFCARQYVIFKKDEIKGYFVLMGVKGSVNTTEIGVFFTDLNDTKTKIEITSLSTNAKRSVAKSLFHELDIVYGIIPPDIKEDPRIDGKNP